MPRSGIIRFSYACAFFLMALLAVFRAPSYHLWMLAIVATEWGHALAVASLLPFAPGWRKSPLRKAAAGISVASFFLFLSPLIRSTILAPTVAPGMEAVFGPSFAISTPLSFKNIFLGVPIPVVQQTTEIYSRSRGEDLALELYHPPSTPIPAPVVLVIHGGSWQSGSRLELDPLSRYLAGRGYFVASLDYRLAPRTKFPGPIEDVRDALAHLKRRSRELGLDMTRVAVLGRSAGAQIALSAAHAPEPLRGLKALVVFYGPNDMHLAWRVPGPKRVIDTRTLLRQYLGGSPAEFPALYDSASPLLRAGKSSPPTLMIHGGRDELVWPLHEYRLAEKLKAGGVPHYFLNMPWATHGCDYNFSGPCGQLSTYAVERFLAFALK